MEKRKSTNFLQEYILDKNTENSFDSLCFIRTIILYIQKRLMAKLYVLSIEKKLVPYSISFIFFQEHLLLIQDQNFYRNIEKNEKKPTISIEPVN